MGHCEKKLCRLLIVEDEYILRQGIEQLGRWEEYGFLLLPSAKNGLEASAYLEQYQPDIVLTDIVMPVMDGISLIKLIKEKHPEIEIIVLSNYDDYKYVHEALKLGAADYLLKAQVSFEQLISVLKGVQQTVLQKSHSASQNAGSNPEMEKEIYLTRLLTSEQCFDQDEIWKKLSAYRLCPGAGEYCVTLLKGEVDDQAVKQILASRDGFSLRIAKNMTAESKVARSMIAFVSSYTRAWPGQLQQILSRLPEVKGAIGRKTNDLSRLYVSYQSAAAGLEYCFYMESGQPFDMNTARLYERELVFNNKELQEAVAAFDVDKIRQSAEMLCLEAVADGFAAPADFLKLVEGFVHIVFAKRRQRETKELLECLKRLENCRTYEELCRAFKATIDQMLGAKGTENSIITKITHYLDVNYATAISLQELAKTFNVNYSYLSQLFKQQTDTSFSTYLNKIRIEKACGFLREGRSVSEVCELVGYNDLSYFGKVFKKYTGVLPSEINR